MSTAWEGPGGGEKRCSRSSNEGPMSSSSSELMLRKYGDSIGEEVLATNLGFSFFLGFSFLSFLSCLSFLFFFFFTGAWVDVDGWGWVSSSSVSSESPSWEYSKNNNDNSWATIIIHYKRT